jgi:hypothetical protein
MHTTLFLAIVDTLVFFGYATLFAWLAFLLGMSAVTFYDYAQRRKALAKHAKALKAISHE